MPDRVNRASPASKQGQSPATSKAQRPPEIVSVWLFSGQFVIVSDSAKNNAGSAALKIFVFSALRNFKTANTRSPFASVLELCPYDR